MSTARKRLLLVGISAAVALGVGIPTVLAGGGGGGKGADGDVSPAVIIDSSLSGDLPHSAIFVRDIPSGGGDSTTSTTYVNLPGTVSFSLPVATSHIPHDPHPPAPFRYAAKVTLSLESGAPLGDAMNVKLQDSVNGGPFSDVGAPTYVQYSGAGTNNDVSAHAFTFIIPDLIEGNHTIRLRYKSVNGGIVRVFNRAIDVSYSDPK
jgi:hypothetical protein